MNRMPRTRLVLIVSIVLVLLTVPLAGARPVEPPSAADRSDGGWWEAALSWLQDLAGILRPTTGSREPSSPRDRTKSGNSSTGSGCIDPTGVPRPSCES